MMQDMMTDRENDNAGKNTRKRRRGRDGRFRSRVLSLNSSLPDIHLNSLARTAQYQP